MFKNYILPLIIFSIALQLSAQDFKKVSTMKAYEGFFNFYYDIKSDKVYIEVSDLNKEFLYVNALAAGVGSNDLGLDRGQLGKTAVVHFERAGDKLLLIQPNLKFRAITTNQEEKKSVKEAFAKSVLFGFKIVEENKGAFLIDASDFLIRDAHGISNKLRTRNQGSYQLDRSKSAMYLNRTKAFPKNVEFEAMLTFKGEAKGAYIKSVTPNPDLVTIRQHHSFVELPDSNYTKRKFDPRAGAISISYMDYATPVTSDITKRYIIRHRLEKKNPNALKSEAVEPIVYYLDRGAPEPIKSALLEGGSWWNQAFEAAGYENAFQIKVLPEGVDPLDIRYNVIQWVHRSTRGWSYGGSVVDPRTGEILKGHVSLGSLRIRQDYLIAQALLGAPESKEEEKRLMELALARIRQLSAHEIGHTLGFVHNFAASVNNRASVMDYPHPLVELKNGKIDISNAYDNEIGAWDKVAVKYAYQDFPDGTDENNALHAILQEAIDKGFQFISDSDARAQGGAHSKAHLWDNGNNASEELDRVMKIREIAISQFSESNIKSGEPYSKLEDVFVPLYFFHRYQLEAAVKMVGGLHYTYAVKGDGQTIVSPIDINEERDALNSVLDAIQVNTLKIPKRIVKMFPPRAPGYSRGRESFGSEIGLPFDALNAPASAAEFTLKLLLHPERAARIVQLNAMYPDQLSLEDVIDQLIERSFQLRHKDRYDLEIQQKINLIVLQQIISLSLNSKRSFQAATIAKIKIKSLRKWLLSDESKNLIYREGYLDLINTFLKDPGKIKYDTSPNLPDGSPIGSGIRCDFE